MSCSVVEVVGCCKPRFKCCPAPLVRVMHGIAIVTVGNATLAGWSVFHFCGFRESLDEQGVGFEVVRVLLVGI